MAKARQKHRDGGIPGTVTPLSGIDNLEKDGERLKVYSLHTLLTNKRRRDTRDAARLGDVLLPWFEKHIAAPAKKLEGIVEPWEQLVPREILKHSRLVGFSRGTLLVTLDSATVRAKLDSELRGGLLRKLQTGSKGAVFRVKTQVQHVGQQYQAGV